MGRLVQASPSFNNVIAQILQRKANMKNRLIGYMINNVGRVCRRSQCAVALGVVLGLCMTNSIYAQQTLSLDLRVLVVSTGTASEDIGLDYILKTDTL